MSNNIESHLSEDREFKPSKEFSKKARVSSMAQYKRMHKESVEKPHVFWAREAKELSWDKKWGKVLDWKAPYAKWFVGGKTNVCVNCVDRHVDEGRGNKAAIIWEGEPGDKRTLTYSQLQREVCKFANVLESHGVKSKDRVLIYMPMVVEATVAMLACARIGAVHSIVFGGFSAESIKDRLDDSKATCVITADGGWRRGGVVDLKANVDEALKKDKIVKTVIVLERTGNKVKMKRGRDVWWMMRRPRLPAPTRQSSLTVSIRFSFSIPQGPRVSPRAFSTPQEVIWSTPMPPANTSSICVMTMSTGARPTLVGSLVTPTSPMDRC